MADAPQKTTTPPVASPSSKNDEPVIYAIPDQFYGAALRAKIAGPEGAMNVPKTGERKIDRKSTRLNSSH